MTKTKDKPASGKPDEHITPEKILPTLKSAQIYVARSIYVSSHLLEYHPADAAILFSHAHALSITMPSYMEEKVEDFVFKDLSTHYENLPYKNLVSGFSYLLLRGYKLEKLKNTLKRIFSFQNESGGIGEYKGDVGRIPHTGEILSPLLSEKYVNDALFKMYEPKILRASNFIIEEWNKDYSAGIAVPHKAAYVANTLSKCVHFMDIEKSHTTIQTAVDVLLDLQLDNGAWTFLPKMSMKRVKLASSVPNMTALALYALCDTYLRGDTDIIHDKEKRTRVYNSIKEGCTYLCKTQTPYGFWYGHSIAECTHITGESALALKKSLEVLRNE